MLRNLFSFVRPLESNLIFRTFFEKESSTYTYLLGDSSTKDCVLIDPVLETVERDQEQINALGLKLRYAMNTHCHADHTTGTGKLKEIFKADNCKSVIGWKSEAKADVQVKHGDKIKFGHFVSIILLSFSQPTLIYFVFRNCKCEKPLAIPMVV